MARQGGMHTLQTTALVNEAYLKLQGRVQWQDRTAFLALASRAMRQILVDYARRKSAAKRRSEGERIDADGLLDAFELRSHGLVELDDALERLAAREPDLVRLVELRFFGGRSMEEAAEVLGLSTRTAWRWWQVARAFLRRELDGG